MQIAEGVVYLHDQGVIHSDMRPENILVNATAGQCGGPSPSLDLWLCDFGGSKCEELGLNDYHLPDDPFFDHRMPWVSTQATDIFSLGSIVYTVQTGHWPYREGPPPVTEEKASYESEVQKLMKAGDFPDVSKLSGGNVIKGSWDHQYQTAREVLEAIKTEMVALGIEQTDLTSVIARPCGSYHSMKFLCYK